MKEKTYKNRAVYMAAQKRRIVKDGKTPIMAVYDSAGNCVFCGEAGRCPGWHYKGEEFTTL